MNHGFIFWYSLLTVKNKVSILSFEKVNVSSANMIKSNKSEQYFKSLTYNEFNIGPKMDT